MRPSCCYGVSKLPFRTTASKPKMPRCSFRLSGPWRKDAAKTYTLCGPGSAMRPAKLWGFETAVWHLFATPPQPQTPKMPRCTFRMSPPWRKGAAKTYLVWPRLRNASCKAASLKLSNEPTMAQGCCTYPESPKLVNLLRASIYVIQKK